MKRRLILSLLALGFVFYPRLGAGSADKATCFECHSGKTLTKQRQGRTIALFVDE